MLERRDDAVESLRKLLAQNLRGSGALTGIRLDASISSSIAWRPHVLDEVNHVAWHVLTEHVESESWIQRMKQASEERPDLHLGVALPEPLLLNDEETLLRLNDLNVRVALLTESDTQQQMIFSGSIADIIYERRLRLSVVVAEKILDSLLQRCRDATSAKDKGIALEVLTAVMLSQVDGFEVKDVGVSARSQQTDVVVHNRNTGGVLGRSPIVLAEAKNWSRPPQAGDYGWFARKIQARHGMCRLGYLVTTNRFTRGVKDESMSDSQKDILIVALDKEKLPSLWREIGSGSISQRVENVTMEAAFR
jgi:hypothetical protein